MMKVKSGLAFVLFMGLMILFTACVPGPEMYHVALKYDPGVVKALPKVEGGREVIVTTFRDLRLVDDPVKMGWVLHPGGKKLLVMPVNKYPDVAVTEAVVEYLKRRGLQVKAHHPPWDLKDESIETGWGKLVIGGAIEELEVVCDASERFNPVRKYQARVKIRVIFADGKEKRRIYQTQAEATNSLKDISFSAEKMERQINMALAEAIEKAFSGEEVESLLKSR